MIQLALSHSLYGLHRGILTHFNVFLILALFLPNRAEIVSGR